MELVRSLEIENFAKLARDDFFKIQQACLEPARAANPNHGERTAKATRSKSSRTQDGRQLRRSAIYLNSGSWLAGWLVEMNQNLQLRKIGSERWSSKARSNNNHSRYGGKMRRPPRRMQATANNQSKAIKAMLFAASSGGKFLATLAVICLLVLTAVPWTIIQRSSSSNRKFRALAGLGLKISGF